jgi:chromosome segregation ATPase
MSDRCIGCAARDDEIKRLQQELEKATTEALDEFNQKVKLKQELEKVNGKLDAMTRNCSSVSRKLAEAKLVGQGLIELAERAEKENQRLRDALRPFALASRDIVPFSLRGPQEIAIELLKEARDGV